MRSIERRDTGESHEVKASIFGGVHTRADAPTAPWTAADGLPTMTVDTTRAFATARDPRAAVPASTAFRPAVATQRLSRPLLLSARRVPRAPGCPASLLIARPQLP